MNTEMKEQFSALMDGEADRDAVRFALRAADADASLRATWSRYHVARDVLRRQPVLLAAPGFGDRLMARLDAEDAAPARGGTIGRWVRYASGGAVAAAVAVVALLATAPENPQQTEPLVAGRSMPPAITVSEPTPAANFARAVSATSDPILMPSPFVQPASATRALPGYGYDPRTPLPWRNESFGAQRQGTPYVLLLVPQQPVSGASEQQRPH